MIILRLHRVLILPVVILVLLWGSTVAASEPAVQSVTLTERGRDLLLSADVSLDLNSQLEDAVSRGLPLYFSVEVEIRRPRWYWFDEVVLSSTQTWRIVYNPLTRQWRVHSGNLALPVGSLVEALSVVRHVRNWRIGERDALRADDRYEGRLRVRFDISQLSKPFQVNALNSSEWSLATPWTEFDVRIGKDAPPPASSAPPSAAQPGLPPPPVPPPGSASSVPLPAAVPSSPLPAQPAPAPVPAPSNGANGNHPGGINGAGANGTNGANGGHGLSLPGASQGNRAGLGLTPPTESQ
ncbi:hypothetical protein CDO44_01010 [Pigmentiphaga sp. NML080357]|uniref:DUF4390 domain-containing protein n=1 Tax=Pigmentiphaga sp. NML080357 TaxID=2008675 RepID=UPI000B417AA3|nr:DUF4390 domain-containing protein [Pigmentiphaga sp. NML080357]OVZ64817.1 hypothetical protein CDO44_01010 [Pigmentiphaga sp. NML080357]